MGGRKDSQGKVVIVSGPSGVGKGTICREVVKRMRDVYLSVSVTTRPKGADEVDGEDYCFISRELFQEWANEGLLLEYAEVFGNMYGTPKDKVEEALGSGRTVILEIDVQGAKQVKAKYPDSVMIFILPPSQRELAERMSGRGRECAEETKERLGGASGEIATGWQYYEHMVINDDLERAVDEVVEIIEGSQA
ncbi:MAG: guanylate kinase [Planctomycetota bacterium]|jgi:guanylate kinase